MLSTVVILSVAVAAFAADFTDIKMSISVHKHLAKDPAARMALFQKYAKCAAEAELPRGFTLNANAAPALEDVYRWRSFGTSQVDDLDCRKRHVDSSSSSSSSSSDNNNNNVARPASLMGNVGRNVVLYDARAAANADGVSRADGDCSVNAWKERCVVEDCKARREFLQRTDVDENTFRLDGDEEYFYRISSSDLDLMKTIPDDATDATRGVAFGQAGLNVNDNTKLVADEAGGQFQLTFRNSLAQASRAAAEAVFDRQVVAATEADKFFRDFVEQNSLKPQTALFRTQSTQVIYEADNAFKLRNNANAIDIEFHFYYPSAAAAAAGMRPTRVELTHGGSIPQADAGDAATIFRRLNHCLQHD